MLLPANRPTIGPNVAPAGVLVARIADEHAMTSEERLSERANLGKRALQRLFQQHVRAGLKWTINRYRPHEAIERLKVGTPLAWTGLALEPGYYDLVHFIRD